MPDDPELIETRPDERLDVSRLESWLRDHLPVSGPLVVRQFGGGHANLTYLVGFGDQEYVLRRPPLGPVAPSSHDMAREHRVLARLGEAFPLAPTSLALCRDTSLIGAEFHVMERRQGFVIRDALPDRLRADAGTVRRLSEMIVDTLADLHQVDPAAVGLGALGRPDGFVERQLSGWTTRWHAAREREIPEVAALSAWLRDHLPRPGPTALLHNDYKLDNLLVATDQDPAATHGRARLGHVHAWTSPDGPGLPPQRLGRGRDDPRWRGATARCPATRRGSWTAARSSSATLVAPARPVDEIRWFHAFGVFKLLVIFQQIYIRYLRGQTQDERFAGLRGADRGRAPTGMTLIDL